MILLLGGSRVLFLDGAAVVAATWFEHIIRQVDITRAVAWNASI